MLIHRARRLLAEIAESLGGTPAGDPRRYRDSSERFAVVRRFLDRPTQTC